MAFSRQVHTPSTIVEVDEVPIIYRGMEPINLTYPLYGGLELLIVKGQGYSSLTRTGILE